MQDLIITWPEGRARFSPNDSPVLVGRSADAAVTLTEPAVSRRHLEFVWLGSSWIANDSSTHGTYDPIGVRLAPTWTVGDGVAVRLGGSAGTELSLDLVADGAAAPEPSPPTPGPAAAPTPPAPPSEPTPDPGPSAGSNGAGNGRGPGVPSPTPGGGSGRPTLATDHSSSPRRTPSTPPTPSAPGPRSRPPVPDAPAPAAASTAGPDRNPAAGGGLLVGDPARSEAPAAPPAPPRPDAPIAEAPPRPAAPQADAPPAPAPPTPDAPDAGRTPPRPSGRNGAAGGDTLPLGGTAPPDNGPGSFEESLARFDAKADLDEPAAPPSIFGPSDEAPRSTPPTPSGPLFAEPSNENGDGPIFHENASPAAEPLAQPPSIFAEPAAEADAGADALAPVQRPPMPPGPEPETRPGDAQAAPDGLGDLTIPSPSSSTPDAFAPSGPDGLPPAADGPLGAPEVAPAAPPSPAGPGLGFEDLRGESPGLGFDDLRGDDDPFGGPKTGLDDPFRGPKTSARAGGFEAGRSPAETIVTDGTIQISVDGKNYTFPPGVDVTVGRDPSSAVHLDERHSLVSRQHLFIEHREGHWWIDDRSSKGTYIDGRRISGPYKAEGAFLANLGDDDAGTPMRIITAGEHRAPRSFNYLLVIAVAALVLLAVAALGYVLLGSREGTTTTAGVDGSASAADLAVAKQATVLLLAEEGFGSGFFVTDDLIVTNQHVAVLSPAMRVAVSRNVDEKAEIEYITELVATHPFLDIAVLKVVSDAEGNPVGSTGLQPVTVGDSGTIELGDMVYSTGFPVDLSPVGQDDMGDLLLPSVSTTSGEAANFSIWPGCSNPTRGEFLPVDAPLGVSCSPDGDLTRAVVISTFSSGQGASGSPVFKDNEVVAVVFSGPEGNENAGRNIATGAFDSWLRGVITANG
ncbi:MAG: FHA domain-containing protein [Actinomycetota bacterium]